MKYSRFFKETIAWHSRGQRFDPAYLHQTKSLEIVIYQRFQGFFVCFCKTVLFSYMMSKQRI
nr:MAG TPA: hypothetical protein [Caudoviricetes sp.]